MAKHKNASYMSCGGASIYIDSEGHQHTSVDQLINILHRLFHRY